MKKLLFSITLLSTICVNAQTWNSLSVGTNDAVGALCVFNGDLYVGGAFTTAGGMGVNGLAKWNGSSWAALPSTINNGVADLLAFDSVLYVGGTFTNAGGTPTNNIAQWNGSNWTTWGSGATTRFGSSWVSAMIIYKGKLIIGGEFDTVEGVAANSVAQWDGTSWKPLGQGIMLNAYNSFSYRGVLPGEVFSMAIYNGELYVAGTFDSVAGLSTEKIASWDGANWHAVGTGIGSYADQFSVNAMCTWNGNLYAGGAFDSAGGVAVQNLAEWNGISWSDFGNGANNDINVLYPYNNDLYVGGYFTSVGSTFANGIAQWDGSSWSELGTGMTVGLSPAVANIYTYNSNLYAGGAFTDASGNTVNNIAEWKGPLGIKDIDSKYPVSIYPNPCDGKFNITISNFSSSSKIEIYNILGELVLSETLPNSANDNIISLSNTPSGVYFYRVLSEADGLVGEGKVVIQK